MGVHRHTQSRDRLFPQEKRIPPSPPDKELYFGKSSLCFYPGFSRTGFLPSVFLDSEKTAAYNEKKRKRRKDEDI